MIIEKHYNFYEKKTDMSKKIELKQVLQDFQDKKINIGKAYEKICDLFNIESINYPIYNQGEKVKWQDSYFYVVEDNGDYNVLIANTPDLNDDRYNDWWVDKDFISL